MIRPVIHSASFAALVAIALSASPALASTVTGVAIDPATIIIPDSGDSAWHFASLLIGVLTAIPGIILFVAGSHTRAALLRIVTAATAAMALATMLFFLIGYSLVFDPAGSTWIGAGSNWMLNLMGTVRDGTTVPETGFVLLHWGFVMIAVTLLAALLAPRARSGWLLGFSALWLLLVQVPIMRWMWGGGWLMEMGTIDASGGLTIFLTVASSALVAMVLIGRPLETETVPQDRLMRLSGALLLLVGMTALAGGATLGAGDDAAVAMLVMVTAAMTGGLTAAALNRSICAGAMASGLVAAIVAVTVMGDGVSIGAAWLTGALAAIAAHFGPRMVPKLLTWPDQGGIATSLVVAATIGGLLTAIFLSFNDFGGSGYAETMTMTSQLVAQLIGISAILGWSVFGTIVAALMVGMLLPMRDEAA